MELPSNHFKTALAQGQRQLGLWVTVPDGGQVEMLAGCGYDWLLIDTEHSPMEGSAILPLLQAAAPYPVTCLVRAGWNDPVEIKKILDCGAQGVLVPYVQNAEEAAAAVAATRYPPKGIRGVAGATRASRFGAVADYVAKADDEICVLIQAETAEALSHIEAMAAVEGVDGIFIGPADLAASMGHPGNPGHPDVRAAIMDGIMRIRAAGKPAGILSFDQSVLRDAADAGAQFIALGLDIALLRRAALELRSDWD